MNKILLIVAAIVAVELILMVWVGRAIGYRDRISRMKRRERYLEADGSVADGYEATPAAAG